MLLRDPVHGLVSFEGEDGRVVAALLQTREVQRLRRVRQLGLTSLVFPGAEHSRFAHAVGAAHVMVRLQQRIRATEAVLPADRRMTDEDARDALAAALLHDLGHGPFSHLFEELVPSAPSHERWTAAILRDPATEVNRALEAVSQGMSERVAALIDGRTRLPYLARSVSGALDVDRCDYLLRDSHMTGVSYGLYDLDWVLRALNFDEAPNGEWVLAIEGRKGLPPIEAFFLARHSMFRQVYHHKATRAAESLVRMLFKRLLTLAADGRAPAPLPPAVAAAARGEAIALSDYLRLDDARLMTAFAEWEDAEDPLLRDLARRLAVRSLPKTLPLPGDRGVQEELLRRGRLIAEEKGLPPDLAVFVDRPCDVLFAEPPRGAAGLWVSIRHKPIRRLGDVSGLLGHLRNEPMETARLVFLPELREPIHEAASEVLS